MIKGDLSCTQTALNLAKAFAGESQARTRYLFYSEIAKAEGYPTLEEIFLITADNERGHAETFFDYLTEGLPATTLEPPVLVPIGKKTTAENLTYASQGEHEEWSLLYPAFGKTAEEEGFCLIAKSFFSIAEVEKRHDARYRNLLDRLLNDTLFSSKTEVVWECLNCGYRHTGLSAPEICPACRHPQSYYRIV